MARGNIYFLRGKIKVSLIGFKKKISLLSKIPQSLKNPTLLFNTTSPPQPQATRTPSSLPNKRPFPLSTLNHDLILEFALQDIKSSSQKHVQNANTHIFHPLSSSAESSSKTTSKPHEKPADEEFGRVHESKLGAPLDFTKVWSFEVLGIKVLLQLQFILKMGWFVVQGEARENGYQVTYIPFLLGYSYLWTDVDAGISKFYIDPNFQYVWMYVPIDVVLMGCVVR